jgi:GNAT superfamily N-acetyltransferase
MSEFLCEPLSEGHDRNAFRCGIAELDVYLRERAGQDVRRRVAAVFVMVSKDAPGRIAGFYTLSSASVVLNELPAGIRRKLPRYPMVPAILIGRLAREVELKGVGRLLLLDALTRSLRHTKEVAAAVVLVDTMNVQARQFYERYGFESVLHTASRMFLPMRTVEKLLK